MYYICNSTSTSLFNITSISTWYYRSGSTTTISSFIAWVSSFVSRIITAFVSCIAIFVSTIASWVITRIISRITTRVIPAVVFRIRILNFNSFNWRYIFFLNRKDIPYLYCKISTTRNIYSISTTSMSDTYLTIANLPYTWLIDNSLIITKSVFV